MAFFWNILLLSRISYLVFCEQAFVKNWKFLLAVFLTCEINIERVLDSTWEMYRLSTNTATRFDWSWVHVQKCVVLTDSYTIVYF